MVGWLEITIQLAKLVKKNVDKYEVLEGEKYEAQLIFWSKMADDYNRLLLGNIR